MLYRILSFPIANLPFELSKVLWLIRLRWAALLLFFILSYPLYIYDYLTTQTLVIYVGVLSFVFIFNFLTQLYFQEKKQEISPFVIVFQLVFDLIILTVFLFLAGGYQNPFTGLFFMNAAIAAVLIRGQYSWPFVFVIHSFILILQIEFYQTNAALLKRSAFMYLAALHFLILAVWFVMRKLGDELEAHYQRKNKSLLQLEKMDRLRSLGALAAGFSHEFASPLNAIKMNLEWILKNQNQMSSSDLKDTILKTQSAVQSCVEVVQQMNSSQLDVRNFQIKPVNLSDLTLDVIESWKEENPQASVKLQIQPDIQCTVPVLNYAQVLMNLFDNAFQAAPSGPIYFKLAQRKQLIELEVQDSGAGFSAEVLQKKGEPFLTTKSNGTGLGLYVTGLFVESLGGEWQLINQTGAVVRLSWNIN